MVKITICNIWDKYGTTYGTFVKFIHHMSNNAHGKKRYTICHHVVSPCPQQTLYTG